MNNEDVVKALLENQKSMADGQGRVSKIMDEIEPFSWMDEQMRQCLAARLSEEDMIKLDKVARANFAGQKIMARAIRKAFPPPE